MRGSGSPARSARPIVRRGDIVAKLNDHSTRDMPMWELRQTMAGPAGSTLAIELVRDRRSGEPFDWRERRGLRLYEYALSQGVLLSEAFADSCGAPVLSLGSHTLKGIAEPQRVYGLPNLGP